MSAMNKERSNAVAGQGERQVRRMVEMSKDRYESEDGYVMKREYGMTPNGNPLNGKWVLRDASGKMLDFDRYRHDLEEKYSLRLECA